jgi:hypothetical protein
MGDQAIAQCAGAVGRHLLVDRLQLRIEAAEAVLFRQRESLAQADLNADVTGIEGGEHRDR